MKVKSLSHVQLFVTPWTVACQAPPFMEFSQKEYWSGLPLPSPGDLSDPGVEPGSPTLQADSLSHQEIPNLNMSGANTHSSIKEKTQKLPKSALGMNRLLNP